MKTPRVHSFLLPTLIAALVLMLATSAPAQIYTNLYSFQYSSQGQGFTNGAYPYAGLVQGSDGYFYGTTGYGGFGLGSVFRLTVVPEPPELTIIDYGANVILTWPTNATGFNATSFILEFATNLVSPAVWQTNSAAPIVIGGQNVVINPITGARMFFRLFSQ